MENAFLKEGANFAHYFERSDKGLADFFVDNYGTEIKVTHVNGSGYLWDDVAKKWEPFYGPELEVCVSDIIEEKIRGVMDSGLDGKRCETLRQLLQKKVLCHKAFGGAFQMVKTKLFIRDKDSGFEQKLDVGKPHELPIRGGQMVDLRTGRVRQRTKADWFSTELDVTFLGNNMSKCQRAVRFFDQLCGGRKELMSYMLQVMGYCLTGETRGKAVFLLVGKGNNGKTTLMKIMEAILGRYYAPCSKQVFLKAKGHHHNPNAPTPEVMALKGKRMVSCTELSEDEKFDEAQVKTLTGGGTIYGRDLYKDRQTFPNYAKIVMETNEVPLFNTDDVALESRMRLLPFLSCFARPGRDVVDASGGIYEEDQAFVDSLLTREGLDEIFTLLICCGTVPWYEGGCVLVEPALCREQWNALVREERDAFRDFLKYKCVTGSSTLCVKRVVLYNAYTVWCKENGYTELSNRKFYDKMRALNYKENKSSGEYGFLGIDLLPVQHE